MKHVALRWLGIWKESSGTAAIEYALVASIISIAAVAAFLELGNRSNDNYETVVEALEE